MCEEALNRPVEDQQALEQSRINVPSRAYLFASRFQLHSFFLFGLKVFSLSPAALLSERYCQGYALILK